MKALELPDTTLPSGALSPSQASLIASAEGAAGAHADGGEKLFHLLRHFSFFLFFIFFFPPLLQPVTQIYTLILYLMLSGLRMRLDGSVCDRLGDQTADRVVCT